MKERKKGIEENFKEKELDKFIDNLSNVILIVSVTSIVYLISFPFISQYIYSIILSVDPDYQITEATSGLQGIRSRLDIVGLLSYVLFILANIIIVFAIYRGYLRVILIISILLSSLISFGIFVFIFLILSEIISVYITASDISPYIRSSEYWDYNMTMLPLIFIFIIIFLAILILINKIYGEKIKLLMKKIK